MPNLLILTHPLDRGYLFLKGKEMNNFDYTNLTTRELLEKALNGEIPIPLVYKPNRQSVQMGF